MNSQTTIIFFDGVCHLCNGFVDFLIQADRKRKLKFAPLQGTTAAEKLSSADRHRLESVVLWQDGKTWYQAEAILRVFSELGGLYSLFSIFRLLPLAWLNYLYRQIALRRYRWFGEKDVCRLPTPEEKEFLLP